MSWTAYFRGDGQVHDVELPPPPPWRRFPPPLTDDADRGLFQVPDGLVEVVNAALCLRRPLLVTGAPGSGKSSVAAAVALELDLGRVLRWHVTSRSILADALYRYDALGRLHAHQLGHTDAIERYLRLGPLGTAMLPSERPRVLLIDEIDKSDIDLPSDLLDILERGEFEIPELSRHDQSEMLIRDWDGEERHRIIRGEVRCTEFPFIVMTSNGEREFPPPFLRRCLRFAMPAPDVQMLARIVKAHLGEEASARADELLDEFADRVRRGQSLATDQLLNAVFLVTRELAPDAQERERLLGVLLRELTSL
jgi:MoxR-like ATPase